MLADRGGDILLIDGGGPGATLSFELGHARSAGLSQWLAAPSSWSKWIQPTSLRNLYFLPSGSGDLQTDSDWPQALQSLRSTFRQVVINAIESPPARLEILARAATATYLTVPLGLAETLPAQQTLARLRSIGCVCSDVSPPSRPVRKTLPRKGSPTRKRRSVVPRETFARPNKHRAFVQFAPLRPFIDRGAIDDTKYRSSSSGPAER